MKNIYYLIIIMILGSSQLASAQWEGQKFIIGSASIRFDNSNPDTQPSAYTYGYGLNIGLGKFKTSTRASGWNISTYLAGRKENIPTYPNGGMIYNEKTGVNGFGVGAGHFWQFYKHFNDHFGIYVGPDIGALYATSLNFSNQYYGSALVGTRVNTVNLSAGLSAGLYYKLSKKWWVTGTIALSNFASVNYVFTKQETGPANVESKQRVFRYSFSPSFQFPSVGFGVRYFL